VQSTCEANNHSASQKIPCLLGNPNVHYRVHKGPLLVLILRQMNSVHIPYSIKIDFNIILPSMPRSIIWSLLTGFPTKNFLCTQHAQER